MNKKFLSAILFGALMITSAGTFVSCKDYDDDIDQINEQLADLEDQIAALQSKINSGEWVSSVTSTANGIKVTLGNGQSFDITNGKDGAAGAPGAAGAAGENGKTPQIAVKDGYIQVSYDGSTWTNLIALADLKGEAGKDAAEPIFSVGEDGHIYVQMGEDAEKKDLGVSTGGIYVVEQGPAIVLHVCDKEGNWKDVVLPKTAAITSIKALKVEKEEIKGEFAEVEVGYTIAAANGKFFNGTAFEKGDVLTTTDSKVIAQVNPTMADASVYNFYLTDSKGASIFTMGTAAPYMTDKALSRAASANKGIYEMPIEVKAGTTEKALKAGGTYAIATADAYGNEILSNYDVKVTGKAITASSVVVKDTIVAINEEFDFVKNGIVDFEDVVDIKYYFADAQKAAVEAAGASINGSVIKGTVANKSVVVTVEWLGADGSSKTGTVDNKKTFTVTFVTESQTGAASIEWTVNTKNVKDSIDVTAYNLTTANVQLVDAKKNNAEGIDTGALKTYTDKYGYSKTYLVFTFDPVKAKPGTYTAVKAYGDQDRSEFTITVTVKDPAATYDFKPLEAYFNADKTEATAYGTYDATNGITYDLYNLFNITDKNNVYFSEVVPGKTTVEKVEYTANAWLSGVATADPHKGYTQNSMIKVDKAGYDKDNKKYAGAYHARTIKVKYVPFGNANLKPVELTFALTVKSEIYEGTLEYVKYDDKNKKYLAGELKVIEGDTVSLKLNEILAKDVYGIEYKLANTMDTRLNNVKVVLANDNAKQYLRLSTGTTPATEIANWDGTEIKIFKASANTAIVTPPTCTVQVQVTDQWGKTKTVDVQVKVNK